MNLKIAKPEHGAREYLKRIRRLDEAANAAMGELETIESDITHITPKYDGMPRTNGNVSDTSGAVARLMAARDKCNAAIDAYVEHKTRCMELIGMIRHPKLAEALVLRYVKYCRYEEIAARMHYSERQVYYIHRRALHVFSRLLEEMQSEC